MNTPDLRDLFVVVADLDMENVIKTLLCVRKHALGIELAFDLTRDLLRYNKKDSGCYRDAQDLLRTRRKYYRHALILFDRHGSGVDYKSRIDIENDIEERLHACGWPRESATAIVIDPELEAWVWSDSPHVASALGWDDNRELRVYLEHKNLWVSGAMKPDDPKHALDNALRERKRIGGARLFADLASKVGMNRCDDPSFVKFRTTLQRWFTVNRD